MWVNSKTAAAVLSVDLKAIQQGVYRATKQGKNFCSVKLNILRFTYLNGIGRGGTVLQIWIADEIIAEFESKNGVRVERDRIVSVGASGSAVGGSVANDGEFASVAKNAIVGS
ncbi:MAG: hypothetical protein IJM31_07935, partial [Campylobacter sp.]|nr:hypothetical protein [Campylobacter sp.]